MAPNWSSLYAHQFRWRNIWKNVMLHLKTCLMTGNGHTWNKYCKLNIFCLEFQTFIIHPVDITCLRRAAAADDLSPLLYRFKIVTSSKMSFSYNRCSSLSNPSRTVSVEAAISCSWHNAQYYNSKTYTEWKSLHGRTQTLKNFCVELIKPNFQMHHLSVQQTLQC